MHTAFNGYIPLKYQKFCIRKNIINIDFLPNFSDEGIILWITYKLWFGKVSKFFLYFTIVTRKNIAWKFKIVRKIPISFKLRKYVQMHCNSFSECTVKHKTTRRITTQTILFLIWLTSLTMIKKISKRRLKKEIFIIVKHFVLSKNWFVASNFWEFRKHHTEK